MTGYTLQRNEDSYSDLQPLSVLNVWGVVVGDYNRDGRLDFATLANSGDFNGVSIALGQVLASSWRIRTSPLLVPTQPLATESTQPTSTAMVFKIFWRCQLEACV